MGISGLWVRREGRFLWRAIAVDQDDYRAEWVGFSKRWVSWRSRRWLAYRNKYRTGWEHHPNHERRPQ